MGRMKLFITLAALLIAADQSFAARQALNENASPSAKGGLNSNFQKANANFVETYAALDLKEAKAVVQASAPADTTVDWYDTDQETGVLVLKRHNGTTWLRASSHGVQYASSCASITAGMCVDTDDGKLYYHNNTSVVEVGSGGSVDLSAYISKTNTTAFTPTEDYHPATKKYVDDSITAGGGYTDEQAQDAVCLMLSGNTETGITVTCDDVTGKINFVSPTTLASFTDDATHRLVTDTEKTTWNAKQNTLVAGTDYLAPTGSAAGLTGFPTLNQNTTGSAAKLTTARTIGGVSFDGSANISLPGVNAAGTQNTTGNAATATTLQTARTIGGTSFNGSANIDISYANLIGLPPLGTAAALNVGTGANNIVQLNTSGQLPFTIDLMDLTSGGTAISPPGTTGYALTANTSGVITWAAMSGGMATEPLEAGTIELGAASDTTIARSGAGVLTVEGVTVTRTIASNATALGTSAIGSGACATVSSPAPGTATTDTIGWGFNGDPTSTTGYQASANGMLTIVAYPTENNVNFKVCNNTAASITPGAVILNWKVFR